MSRKSSFLYIFLLTIIFLTIGNYIVKVKNPLYLNIFGKNSKQKLSILIEVDMKRLSLIDRVDESVIKTYTIATGKSDSPTPLGSFEIIEMGHWGEGFGSRWMGLNVPWGTYGIHGTNKPGSIGYNISAGCIRMRNQDAEELFSLVKNGTRVVITNGIYGPFGHGFRTLRPGHRGADVLEVQKRLAQKDFYKGSLDGIYGEGMKAALIQFLKSENISLTDSINREIYNALGIYLMD